MSRFAHFLVTRFNVPLHLDVAPRHQPGNKGLTPEWLGPRFELFERFCLPSVRGQTCRNFTWFIYMSTSTPAVFRDRLLAHAAAFPLLKVQLVDAFSTVRLRDDCAAAMPTDADWLITSRMDNDDAIRRDFIGQAQACFATSGRRIINFPLGYSWLDGRLYLDRQRSNPFTTMIEPLADAITIFSSDHRLLGEVGKLEQVNIGPAWMQVIHGGNLMNQRRGIRAFPGDAATDFSLAEDAIHQGDSAVRVVREKMADVLALAKEKGLGRLVSEFTRLATQRRR